MKIHKKSIILIILTICSMFCVLKFSKITMWTMLPEWLSNIFERPSIGTNEYEIWSLIDNLSLAYIASLIFYIVVEYIPKKEKEKKAFAVISSNLQSIYDNLSYIIRVITFEIGLEKNISDIELADLEKVKNIIFDSTTKYADITHVKNNEDLNVKGFSYNVLDDSKLHGNSITKNIDDIFSLQIAGNINEDIVELLSNLKKSRFLSMMSYFEHQNTRRIPGRKNEILFYDKSFYELIQYREAIGKLKIDLLDYRFEKMTDDQISREREERVYWLGRSYFMRMPIEKIQGSISYMPNIVLNEASFSRLNGVLLEALVTYDIDNEQYKHMLPIARSIAEYLCSFNGSEDCIDIACLNYLQVLRRMGTITKKDMIGARQIIADTNKSKFLRLGALIIVRNFAEAKNVFDSLDDNQKFQVVSMPIYRLWNNPPLPANLEQPDFNIYE
ncbi:MAG: hypothetical protein UHN47_07835 [Lachnospiraceae bacterium]|nr:hypothetical protein [Lachnospiraceae bacterium]